MVNFVIYAGIKDLWFIVGLILPSYVYSVIETFIPPMHFLDAFRVVRCIEQMILCQNCNWCSHTALASRTGHKRQTINCYSGCPSAAELSRIWSFFSIDFSSSNLEEDSSSLEKDDKNLSRHPVSPFDHTEEAAMDPMASDIDQFCGSGSSDPLNEKVQFPCIPAILAVCWSMGEEFQEGIDSLFEIGKVLDAEFDAESILLAKGSDRKSKTMLQACTVSSISITNCKSDPNICFPRAAPAPAPSALSLPFSGYTNESSTGDHQECGVSPVLSTGGNPFDIPRAENQFLAATRDTAVLIYKEKKKSCRFDKKIRYASCKERADSRKHLKGRFVKTGDPYDYDPSHLATSQ